jgi:uncharacterized membrane protein YgcG
MISLARLGLPRLALALLLLLSVRAPAFAVERILLFISDVTVERNGDLSVTETIRVEAEGREIRRGILRDFPTRYTRPDGSLVEVGFKVQSVTRNGAVETYATESIGNGVRIRIGSANVLLDRGQHEFVIRYRTTRQLGFFADYDELYWNATGNGWTFGIDQAEARITLPAGVPFKQSAFYTGPQGAQGRDASVIQQQPGRIVFRTTRPLPPRSGLTVAAAWQKGVVDVPSSAQQAGYWLGDNLLIVFGVLGSALLLGYYAFAWTRVGRDPTAGTIIPMFAPPGGMSPAAVRFVDRMGFDDRGFTAAIINLGVNGHLRIVDSGKSSTLQRVTGGRAVAAEEQALATNLFRSSHSVQLVQTNHETLGKAKTALKEGLDSAYLGKLFTNNYGWSGIGLLLLVLLASILVLVTVAGPRYAPAGGLLASLLIPLPFVMMGAAMTFSAWQRTIGGTWQLIAGVIILVIAAAAGLFGVWSTAPGTAHLLVPIVLFATAAVAGLAFQWLKAPSVTGRKTMDDIEGFRLYLGTAEEDRLNAMQSPEKTPELFERFLPYAVALDVQNVWAKRFAGVLAAAGTAAAAWYVGNQNWSNDPVSFTDHLSSDLSSTISSASTAPGSTSSGGGSSGGGSSGGGGGGGGGSGW